MIEYGDVYQFEGVPNLDDGGEKDRYLIVVDPRVVEGQTPLKILCAGASCTTVHPTRILLPNQEDSPSLTRGMPRKSWAVPEWIVVSPPCLMMGDRLTRLTRIEAKAIGDKMLAASAADKAQPRQLECPPGRTCRYCAPNVSVVGPGLPANR